MLGALRRPGVRLALTSATLLFVELVLLRWIPANVTYIGFFSNFLLIWSFLGSRRWDPAGQAVRRRRAVSIPGTGAPQGRSHPRREACIAPARTSPGRVFAS